MQISFMDLATKQTPWFERTFPPIDDNGRLPAIVDRLGSLVLRLRSKLKEQSEDLLSSGQDGKWSVKEEIGHLLTLEPLWFGRLEDLASGRAYLREADLTNRATFEGNFNDQKVIQLCSDLDRARFELIKSLFELNESDLTRTSLHPRLKQPMRVVDLCNFIAEHDDHHLVRIQRILIPTV